MGETAKGRVFDADGFLVATEGQEVPDDAKKPLRHEDEFVTTASQEASGTAADRPVPTVDGKPVEFADEPGSRRRSK